MAEQRESPYSRYHKMRSAVEGLSRMECRIGRECEEDVAHGSKRRNLLMLYCMQEKPDKVV